MHLNTHLSIIYNMLTKIIIKTVIIVCNVLDTTRMLVLNTGNSYTVCSMHFTAAGVHQGFNFPFISVQGR